MTANPLRAARGTATSIAARVLKEGEFAYNTDTDNLHVGDGATLGGLIVPMGDANARTSWYGADDAALSAAKAAAGAGGVVVIDNDIALSASATLAGYTARFEGGTIAPAASPATLTVDHIEASPYERLFTGANVARVRFNKQPVVFAPWFGQAADGSTDDAAAINAAIGSLPVSGGEVVVLGPVFAIGSAIVIGDGTSSSRSTTTGVRLRGMSFRGATAGEFGSPTDGCRALWIGADSASAAMLDVRGPIHDVAVYDVVWDCAGLAGTGVKARMIANCHFEHTRVTRYTTLAWDVRAHDAALPSGVAVGNAGNDFYDCGCFTPWDSGAFATGASALRMWGGPAHDIAMSRNTIVGGDWHFGGDAGTFGLELMYADNNGFFNALFTSVGGSSSGDSVRLVKNTTGSYVGLMPKENSFFQCPGTEDYKVYDDAGNAISAGSGGIGYNLVVGHSLDDGAAVPTHERITALMHDGELTNLRVRDDRFILQDNGDNTKRVQFQLSGITTGTTRTITVPDADLTVVGVATAQTLTNKTINQSDAAFTLQDDGDATKQARFQCSGITAGQTRTLTIPDTSDTLVTLAATQTLTNKTLTTPTLTRPDIVGTNTNNNAAAGSVGEVIESTVAFGSAVSLTSGTPANVTSISLTAGDWDVWGCVGFAPNAATTVTEILGWISTTSATSPSIPEAGAVAAIKATLTTGAAQALPVGQRRLSLNATTTVYLEARSAFGVNTQSAYGYIGARRVR